MKKTIIVNSLLKSIYIKINHLFFWIKIKINIRNNASLLISFLRTLINVRGKKKRTRLGKAGKFFLEREKFLNVKNYYIILF